jgi:hypothetical protein
MNVLPFVDDNLSRFTIPLQYLHVRNIPCLKTIRLSLPSIHTILREFALSIA